MANNPVSFVDPDGGRAVITEYMKRKILNNLFDNKYKMTRIEWLRGWMSATGMNHYQGVTFEEIYSILGAAPRGGVSRYSTGGSSSSYDFSDNYAALNSLLGPLGGGFLDAPAITQLPGNNGTSGLSDAGSGIFIDGLEVSNFAYNAFVDNTLREDIINVASSNVSFGYSAGKYYDNSQGAFGSGKTNREVREEQNRENRAYSDALREQYKEEWQAIKGALPDGRLRVWVDDKGSLVFKFGLFNQFRRGLAKFVGVDEYANSQGKVFQLELGQNIDIPFWLKNAGGNSGGNGINTTTNHHTKGGTLVFFNNVGGATLQVIINGSPYRTVNGFGIAWGKGGKVAVRTTSVIESSFRYTVYGIQKFRFWHPFYINATIR